MKGSSTATACFITRADFTTCGRNIFPSPNSSRHSRHQHPIDHLNGRTVFFIGLQRIRLDVRRHPLHQPMYHPLLDRPFAPGVVRRDATAAARGLGRMRLGPGRQPLRRIRPPVQHHILAQNQQFRFDIVIDPQHRRIDDPHLHSRPRGVVEKDRVHRLPHRVVAPEREREVAHPAAHPHPRTVGLDPSRGLDKRPPVVVVFLDPGRHGQDIRVEDDVFGRETTLDQ
jgi:hypothetical protein